MEINQINKLLLIKEGISFNVLKSFNVAQLNVIAKSLLIEDPFALKNHELIAQIIKSYLKQEKNIVVEGILELTYETHGFLRFVENKYRNTVFDVYISIHKIRKLNLKPGDIIKATIKDPKETEKHFGVEEVLLVNNKLVSKIFNRVNFENLTPLYPIEKINFELNDKSKADIALRVCDLIAPIGFGQRALIIAKPRSGKTIIMQNMANAISNNYSNVKIIMLLIDERPEEVTDMERSVKAEVISSTFDEPANRHIQIAELAIEKAKRMVEEGENVVIFLDSITRLARAYNTVMPFSGKVLSGGIDANAMEGPKKIFGAARKTEEKGSLTIIGTALDQNKSQMDNYILQEFAGTGNCEIYLDSNLANRRLYPAIDITLSGTRNEDKFFKESELNKRWAIRKIIIPMGAIEGITLLLSKIRATESNQDLFNNLNK